MRPPVDHDMILMLTREGKTADQIAQAVGCNPRTVDRVRKRNGLAKPTPLAGRRMTPELKAMIESRLDEGWPFIEIERTYGISRNTLIRHFRGRGWTPQQVGAYGALIHYAIIPRDLDDKRREVKPEMPLAAVPGRQGLAKILSQVPTPQRRGPSAYRATQGRKSVAA